MPQSVRVTQLDTFRMWKAEDDLGLEWLINRLTVEAPSEKMRAGTAFHKALENSVDGEFSTIEANGYKFEFVKDCAISVPPIRELEVTKMYGDLLVVGHVDAINGPMVKDYKTTEQFDPDRLMSGYQWRMYLDMTGADRFLWDVFVIEEIEPKYYWVKDLHQLEQRRYPDLASDCHKLAEEYSEFARQHNIVTKWELEQMGQIRLGVGESVAETA